MTAMMAIVRLMTMVQTVILMMETMILMAIIAIVRLMAMVDTVILMAMMASHQREREGQSSPPFSSTLLLQFSSEIVTLNTFNAEVSSFDQVLSFDQGSRFDQGLSFDQGSSFDKF